MQTCPWNTAVCYLPPTSHCYRHLLGQYLNFFFNGVELLCYKRERMWMDFPQALIRQRCSSTDELGTGVAWPNTWVRTVVFGGLPPTLKLLLRSKREWMSKQNLELSVHFVQRAWAVSCTQLSLSLVSDCSVTELVKDTFCFLASYNFLWKAVWFGSMLTFRKVSAIIMNSQTQSVILNLYNFTPGDLKSIFWNVAAFSLTTRKKHFALPPAAGEQALPCL